MAKPTTPGRDSLVWRERGFRAALGSKKGGRREGGGRKIPNLIQNLAKQKAPPPPAEPSFLSNYFFLRLLGLAEGGEGSITLGDPNQSPGKRETAQDLCKDRISSFTCQWVQIRIRESLLQACPEKKKKKKKERKEKKKKKKGPLAKISEIF